MRIAWFTPFGDKAAHARHVAEVVAEFQRAGHEPVIFRLDPDPGEPDLRRDVEVRSWRDGAGDCPLSLYSFRDDPATFAAAYDILARRPGLVILHDPSLAAAFEWNGSAAPEALIGREALGAAASTAEQAERLAAACPGPVVHLPAPADGEPAAGYARDLLALGSQALSCSPLTLATRRVGARLAQMGVALGDPLVQRVAEAAAALFPSSARG